MEIFDRAKKLSLSKPSLILAFLVLLFATPRICLLLAAEINGAGPLGFRDARDYDACSNNLLAGRGFSLWPEDKRLAHVPPGYPVFLAAIKRIVGNDINRVRFFQICIWIVMFPVLLSLVQRRFGWRVATIFGILTALSPLHIYWDWQIATESLAFNLLSFSCLTLLQSLHRKSLPLFVVSIVLLGCLAMTRTAYYGFVIIYAVIAILTVKKRGFLYAGAAFLCFFAVVTPWAVRNYLVFHQYVPVTLSIGLEQSVQMRKTGIFADIVDADKYAKKASALAYSQSRPRNPGMEYESEQNLIKLNQEVFLAYPTKALRFFLYNLRRLWTPWIGASDGTPRMWHAVATFPFAGLLFGPALMGLWFLHKTKDRIPFWLFVIILSYYSLGHSYVIGLARYRYALDFILFILTAIFGSSISSYRLPGGCFRRGALTPAGKTAQT